VLLPLLLLLLLLPLVSLYAPVGTLQGRCPDFHQADYWCNTAYLCLLLPLLPLLLLLSPLPL
jgi:hypothetical protein